MPQLDKITFLSQIFWLLFIFLSFYLITLRYLLPTVSQILKIRRKKLESDSQQLTNFKEEEYFVTENYEAVLKRSFVECQKLLMDTLNSSLLWLDTSLKKTNETSLLEMNKQYLRTIAEISGKKHLIQSCVHQTNTK